MKSYSITLPYTQTISKILPVFQELDYTHWSSILVVGILNKDPRKMRYILAPYSNNQNKITYSGSSNIHDAFIQFDKITP